MTVMRRDIPRAPMPRMLAIVILFFGLFGCASVAAGDGHPSDPFERYNRAVFAFNQGFDRTVLEPAATGYRRLPDPVQTGIGNFFGNMADVRNAVNNLLQGKFENAATDTGRIVLNTTVGVVGLIDVASAVGLPKHQEDFGQTLGVWGVPAGPYLQIPFLGPSTLRDAPALVVDWYTHPAPYVLHDYSEVLIGLAGLRIVQFRASALGTEDLLETISDDPYVALREFWLQRREFLVRDGAPADDDLWFDELDALDQLEMLEQEEAFP